MNLGTELFRNMTDANNAAQEHIRIGRSFMARDVLSIIGTASARKDFAAVVAEIQALCEEHK
jgi:hypothetical protein